MRKEKRDLPRTPVLKMVDAPGRWRGSFLQLQPTQAIGGKPHLLSVEEERKRLSIQTGEILKLDGIHPALARLAF